ncbi:MAG: Gfo/Idh/MocA family oxidoreductase [Candidatus Competibacter sp.]|nr:Gfo/Idh/MocA family oxidoreductase [Candidatus Competibacter sp.]
MISIGVIGYGYWGPNLVRNFHESGVARVTLVSDRDPSRLKLVKTRYPVIETTPDHTELINSPNVDAVAIATPVGTHFRLALAALRAGKHVFVEKPLTETADQARQLIEEAEKRGLILMVDHTFIYTGAVRKIKALVAGGELGEIYYYDSERVNLGLFQPDVNVIWDLAVHDLAIMNYVFPDQPVAVSATGVGHVPGKPANVAYLTLYFNSPMIAHINVNWLAPVKLRRTLIGGDRKMIVYDDLEPSEKIKIYDKGIELTNRESIYETLIGYRTGDMYVPKLDGTEALRREARHFVESVENHTQPESSGEAGLYVVRILEAATQSMNARGAPLELA